MSDSPEKAESKPQLVIGSDHGDCAPVILPHHRTCRFEFRTHAGAHEGSCLQLPGWLILGLALTHKRGSTTGFEHLLWIQVAI